MYKFLESNPDHSMHCCNYFREYLDGNRVLQHSESMQNFSRTGNYLNSMIDLPILNFEDVVRLVLCYAEKFEAFGTQES